MRALQIPQPGVIQETDMDMPELKHGEVLLKIVYVGFCGSDLNTFLGKNPMVKLPVIPGHEISAVIEKVADGVPELYREGAVCTVSPYTNCGYCPSCRNGRPNACRNNQTLGVQRDGAMREYLAVPWQKMLLVNDIPAQDVALIEPMSVGFHAVSRGGVTDTDTVLVIGCGMVGMGAVIRSSTRGATVIAMDIDNDKLLLAKQLGATHTINSATENAGKVLAELTSGNGPDVIIEAVGAAATYRFAIEEVAFTGRVVYIGYAKEEIAFQTKNFVMKELDIRGSRNATPEDFRGVISYLQKGICPTEKLISGIYSPKQAQDALATWQANPGKVFRLLVMMNESL